MEKEPTYRNDHGAAKPDFLKLVLNDSALEERTDNTTGVEEASEILFITTFPPQECGVSSYSYDLTQALGNKFSAFKIKICVIESVAKRHKYPANVKWSLNPSNPESYEHLLETVNGRSAIKLVVLQYEKDFFDGCEECLVNFLGSLKKPIVTIVHSMQPEPDAATRENVQRISSASDVVIAMTENAVKILTGEYKLRKEKIVLIPYGSHLVSHLDKDFLKNKYGLRNRRVLSTFGFLDPKKSIETTLEALPQIVKTSPDVIFLVLGKTNANTLQEEGEKYRTYLESKVAELKLQDHVRFVNYHLPLNNLLEYLQLTDIYLFTSIDSTRVVNETISYAMSCACPVISTPVTYAREMLANDVGIFVEHKNPRMLCEAVNRLLYNEKLRRELSLKSLRRVAVNSWENISILYARLFRDLLGEEIILSQNLPRINFAGLKNNTTNFGVVQYSCLNQPDMNAGYTLNDNIIALVTMCSKYELQAEENDLHHVQTYFSFMQHCLQTESYFLNHVDRKGVFTEENNTSNLADVNGKAIWALGYLISLRSVLPSALIESADMMMKKVLFKINTLHSTRAMAFTIKGLYYYNIDKRSEEISSSIKGLANRLVQMFRQSSEKSWHWYESYMAGINSVLPEALLCAYETTGENIYREVAKASFDFLLEQMSAKEPLRSVNGQEPVFHAKDQCIDTSYTILALDRFYHVFKEKAYLEKMQKAFAWFHGDNNLQQIIYNPGTGGCYGSLDKKSADLDQGTTSTLHYLVARLVMEKYAVKGQMRSLPLIKDANAGADASINDKLQGQKQVA